MADIAQKVESAYPYAQRRDTLVNFYFGTMLSGSTYYVTVGSIPVLDVDTQVQATAVATSMNNAIKPVVAWVNTLCLAKIKQILASS